VDFRDIINLAASFTENYKFDYKPLDEVEGYTYEHGSNGFTRYHAGGGVLVIAIILCLIRCSLFFCRTQKAATRPGGIIVVRGKTVFL